MGSPLIETLLGRAAWMDRPGEALQNFWHRLFKILGALGPPLKDFLHGTWLGHPLHALLTDVPIGAWTALVLLDLVDIVTGESFGRAPDLVLWLGVLAALAAWLAGYTDWSDTVDLERRTGLTHGVLMTVGILLFVVSGLMRLPGDGVAAPATVSLIGYLVVAVGAYFGGELPFGFGTQVNRNAFIPLPEDFVPVARADEIAEGAPVLGRGPDGLRVLLFQQGGEITAINDVCAHAGGPLHEGEVRDGIVTCPWHGSRFRIRDGALRGGPATFPQVRFQVRVRAGTVEVKTQKP